MFTDTPTDLTQEEVDHAINAIDSYGSKLNPVWEDHTDDSGGDVSFADSEPVETKVSLRYDYAILKF